MCVSVVDRRCMDFFIIKGVMWSGPGDLFGLKWETRARISSSVTGLIVG